MDFVHLNLHTEYSLLESACRVNDIPGAVSSLGQKAVAITDSGNMFGTAAFYDACKKSNIKPIIGCEINVVENRYLRDVRPEERESLVLLVKNDVGYRNLIKIVSKTNTEGFHRIPRADVELLSGYSEGLICLSGGKNGKISSLLLMGKTAEAENYAVMLGKIFGEGNFYLELNDFGFDSDRAVNESLAFLSEKTGLPLVATNCVHYLKKEDADIQNVLNCIGSGRTIDSDDGNVASKEQYLKSGDEMKVLFGKYDGAVENTVKIADKCNFDFTYGKTVLPEFVPPDGMNDKDYLRLLTENGLEERISAREIVFCDGRTKDDYEARIKYELFVIGTMGYSSYFLIVADFVNWAKGHNVPTGPGRGSGAGSLVAFLIGITEVDPMVYGLLFEAFLNQQRISMPDFDIDFGDRKRDEVIGYVGEKYGEDRVSQIITFGTLAAKAALRDVGRVLGMKYGDVDRVVRALPEIKGGVSFEDALKDSEFLQLYNSDWDIRRLVDIASKIEGMPRNVSVHAAGVVITAKPVSDYVPLAVSGDITVTQFDMDTIARMGLLKFDFLAIRYLTVIDDCEKMIRESGDEFFSVAKMRLDDEDTYKLVASGKTDGLFQLESGGMMKLLAEMKPEKITDIMVAIALYRPGPMDSIPVFLRNRKEGKIEYPIDCLAPILDETNGCIVYQEQVMEIFRSVAGYSYGRADVVRRAIAKKKPGVLEQEKDGFINGGVNRGYKKEDCEKLFNDMADFANYAFKKSHSAAYGIISYRTAYLKCHYPEIYYSALLSSVSANTAKVQEYITECGKSGIAILPPDVNESNGDFTPLDGAIRLGLSAIKGISSAFSEKIVLQRQFGKFTSFHDFVLRNVSGEVSKRQIEALIKTGAFDSLGKNRNQLLQSYEKLIDGTVSEGRGSPAGQIGFFGASEFRFEYPDVGEVPKSVLLEWEKEYCGICISGSLLDEYSKNALSFRCKPIRELPDEPVKQVITCGIVRNRNDKTTKKGEKMLTCVLSDGFFEIPVLLFPKEYQQFSAMFIDGNALAVNGELSIDERGKTLFAKRASPLVDNSRFREPEKSEPAAPKQNEIQSAPKPKRLFIRVESAGCPVGRRCRAVAEIFDGMTEMYFYDMSESKYRFVCRIQVSDFVLNNLKSIAGLENVVLK